ncbi:MAG TPA: S8 family serine peptidase, partial [Vicinamibacterales bacterium]
MRRIAFGLICAGVVVFALALREVRSDERLPPQQRRMSFHNRLLLNRAMLAGLSRIEVLLLLDRAPEAAGAFSAVAASLGTLEGRILSTDPSIGYARVELPPDRLFDLVDTPVIEAYQISSLSRGAWYRDGPPEANATMFRGYEVTPITGTEPSSEYANLPELTPAEARAPGFTADEDAGVGEWMRRHPTFDGRGVTIAILENALPSFADPVFRTALTLEGQEVPKIAGILNTIDPAHIDDTRVRLTIPVDASTSWTRVDTRTYVFPAPGKYWLGMLEIPAGDSAVNRFAVIERDDTGQVWIDANGDASFQDEAPLADVNERFEPRFLKVRYPQPLDVSFVMSRAAEPHVVHIYPGRSSHQSMTASVAAGNRTDESLASGVAPGARLLFVRMTTSADGLAGVMEGFLRAARRTDVDLLTSSHGLHLIPDTAADFVGLLFSRISEVYRKPIISAAGNFGLMLGHIQAHGGALSVGGTLGPETHAAFYGGVPLPGMIVHPTSAAGPAIDGSIKPDFLAPMERIAADPPWYRTLEAVPFANPTHRVPPGYEISCCTSASSPYAAGAIALLISAARQSNVPYSVELLSRALRVTARPIDGFQAHQQGNGALDIEAAWQELASGFAPPRIESTATILHSLAQYAARGPIGRGILEFGGWTAPMTDTRTITLRRTSGPAGPVSYTTAWTADDGTFSTPASVTLPPNTDVPLPVRIDVKKPGAHSGLLSLHDPASGAVVFRTQATVVAPARTHAATGTVEITGTLATMHQNAHYLHVPPGADALALELEVARGVLNATLLQAHGLVSTYYMPVHPMDIFSVGPGTYHLVMPNPEPGTWTLRLKNASVRFPAKLMLGPRDDALAEYTVRMRILDVDVTAKPQARTVSLDLHNRGAALTEPVIEAWQGSRRTHRAAFAASGVSNVIDLDVP